jgi:hypothetical protein
LEAATRLTVAEVAIELIGQEAFVMSLIAGQASEDKVDFQLVFSRHF